MAIPHNFMALELHSLTTVSRLYCSSAGLLAQDLHSQTVPDCPPLNSNLTAKDDWLLNWCWPSSAQWFLVFYCLMALLTMGFSSPDMAWGQTPQKIPFLAGAMLQSEAETMVDCTENTASSSSAITAGVSVAAITWWILSHCLVIGLFAEPFSSNGCLWWFLNSDFQQISHNMYSHQTVKWATHLHFMSH